MQMYTSVMTQAVVSSVPLNEVHTVLFHVTSFGTCAPKPLLLSGVVRPQQDSIVFT
jgi:hypothetical protein